MSVESSALLRLRFLWLLYKFRRFVIDELFSEGDNHLNLTEGIDGNIASSLNSLFDPNSQNSFPSALTDAVNNGTIEIK